MRRGRAAWIVLTASVVCLGLVAAAAEKGAAKRKPAARQGAKREGAKKAGAKAAAEAKLLEIPKVTKDKIICFALYTTNNNILKLTAQLYPLEANDPRTVRLEVKEGGQWKEIAKTNVITPGWTAPFRVEPWDMTRDVSYRVRHGESAIYEGLIRHNPVEKNEIVVAAFTGNSIYPGHGGDIPKSDIVENLKKVQPDLLFFSGDQVYDHNQHYAYWLKFGRDFGEIIRVTPTITIPDDHDVGMPNLWGQGGKQALLPTGDDGGYYKPVEYVQEVQRAQTSHLPDPYDPTPVERGISVYYTSMNLGGISFAILEDRKFKTGPEPLQIVEKRLGKRADHVTNPNYDPKSLDAPWAELLGERQLKFLRDWAADWRGAQMKAVLSQTVFCGGATLHGSRDYRVYCDLDSNGWPQTGRNKALAEIRKAFAVHIAGDQHLGTVIHQGIDDWDDACWSFCVPSIANLYLRWWVPEKPGKNRRPGAPEYTGQFEDGFGNKINMWAVANPSPEENSDKLTTRAAGYGLVRFNKDRRTVTFECWPRNTDITNPQSKQYAGWPVTVAQLDNYARKPAAYLPVLKISGIKDPVIQVIDERNGEIVYTLRIRGQEFRPMVFHEGSYTVKIGDQERKNIELKAVKSLAAGEERAMEVNLE